MSTFETALKFWWGPLMGGGPRRLPHLPHSKSAPDYPNTIRSHLVTIVPMAPFILKSISKLRSALHIIIIIIIIFI